MEFLNSHPIKKSDLGFHGNLFGGKLLFGSKLLYLYKTQNMANYRRIWEDVNGAIPVDSEGRSYQIHHIDGNRKNNNLNNLQCVSMLEHYDIHLDLFRRYGKMKDLAALRILAGQLGKDPETLTGYKVSQKTKDKISKTLQGRKRPEDLVKRIASKLKGRKQTSESVEARRKGIKEYYQNANEKDLRDRWDKISKAHKGKVVSNETKYKLGKISAKLTDEEALKVAAMIGEGVNYRIISEQFGISQSQISCIKQKKSYKWLWS